MRTILKSSFLATMCVVTATSALGQTQYTVTNNNDSGAGSLRQAITNLNAGPSLASIVFNISGSKVINLQSALSTMQKSVTINSTNVTGIVLDGTNAGFSNGLVFGENTTNFSNVRRLTIQDFQQSGVVVSPQSSFEQVNIDNCHIHSCGANGVTITSGRNHSIVGNSLTESIIENNDGWGIAVTSSTVTGVQVTNGAVQGNLLGGVRFSGDDHELNGVFLVQNGSNESADHRGGVVLGLNSVATNCRVLGCTIAGNTPWGVKRLSGSDSEVRGNETYYNSQQGIEVLGAQPGVTPWFFVVDDIHDEIVLQATATGNANQSLDIEFFVPIGDAPDNQGATYLDTADVTVTLDSSGTKHFYHTFSRNAVFDGVALGLTQPLQFQIDNEDAIVATATSPSSGTSEFSARAEPTLPGDFNFNGAVEGSDFLIWQQNIGRTNAEYWHGDADFDGDVDSADKDIWQANYGQTP